MAAPKHSPSMWRTVRPIEMPEASTCESHLDDIGVFLSVFEREKRMTTQQR